MTVVYGLKSHRPRVATFLPPLYVQRLVLAAEVHDAAEIDAITDELAEHYPELVRLRSARSRFGSAAEGSA